MLAIKVVNLDSKIIISLPWSKSVKQTASRKHGDGQKSALWETQLKKEQQEKLPFWSYCMDIVRSQIQSNLIIITMLKTANVRIADKLKQKNWSQLKLMARNFWVRYQTTKLTNLLKLLLLLMKSEKKLQNKWYDILWMTYWGDLVLLSFFDLARSQDKRDRCLSGRCRSSN